MNKISLILILLIFTGLVKAQDLSFFESKTTIGGYGELHYNYSKNEDSKAKKTLDFHRFVLFVSHSFTEKWSFSSEFEIEHNFVSSGEGELELEQAFVEYRHNKYFGFQAGVLLASVGLTNETHEPPTFFGVERPDYSKYIIPTTWYGNGAALYGNFSGFDYKITVMEGLDGNGIKESSGIRSARYKGYKPNAEEFLYSGRVDYLKINGLKIGASFSFTKAITKSEPINVTLAEAHLVYQKNNFMIVSEIGNISYTNSNLKNSFGYYVDLGYNFGDMIGMEGKLVPFIRYSDVNPASSTIAGGTSDMEYHNQKMMAGINYLPIPNVVFKADLAIVKNELTENQTNLFNLGVGYMF